MKRRFLSSATGLVLIALVLGLTACGKPQQPTKLHVVVSVLPQAEFVESLGGDLVDVSVMIPPGASPATYEPTPKQLRELSKAKLYIRIGHIPFEKAWMSAILKANKQLKVVDSSEGIEVQGNDPHIWNSPSLVKSQVEHIYQGLVSVDPDRQETYTKNRESYLRELDALDADIRQAFEGVEQRVFMVFHPSWGYFAREYDLEQIPIEEEGKEPSAADIAALIETAKQRGIQTVFVQTQFSGDTAEVIAGQIGASVIPIDPLARDYGANLRSVAQKLAEAMR